MVICPHCRRQLDDAPELSGQQARCPGCGLAFQMPHYGGVATGPAVPFVVVSAPRGPRRLSDSRRTNVMLAVLLSFLIPGLGQIAIGRPTAGATFLVCYIISIALCFVVVGFVLLPIVWLWSIIDAAMT